MKYIFTLVFLALVTIAPAQKLQGDVIETTDGSLVIQPILHGTLALEWKDRIIFVDPYGGKEAFEGLPDPDLILITDVHGDHHNPSTLETLNTEKTDFIVPKAVADEMNGQYEVTVIGNGERTTWEGISIEAIPMYNLPETRESRHPRGRGNGYVLTIGGKRVYISGDTEDIPEMRILKDIDVAFVCMNLPYTMDIDQAASGVLAFQPRIVYPFHYRGKDGLADVATFKANVEKQNSAIDVRLRNWYPEN